MVLQLWPSSFAIARIDRPDARRVKICSASSRDSTGPGSAAGRVRGLGGDVGFDGIQGLLGDLLGAVDDSVDGGAADQPQQASDHPVGALVQVAVQASEGARAVAVEPETVF